MKNVIKNNKEEIIVCLIFIFFALGFNVYRVQSDGLFYYRFLEKIFNLPCADNSPAAVKDAFFFQGGCAFFYAPFYLAACVLKSVFNIHRDFNGITLGQASINLASNFYMILSLIMSVKILKKLNFRHIILPVLSILFSTSAFAAAVVIPSFSHSVDIFLCTVFAFLFLGAIESAPYKSLWLGIVIVFAILVRYYNFVLLIPPFLYFLVNKKYRHCLFFIAGFLAASWIIPVVLYTYNGSISPFYSGTYETARSGAFSLLPKYALKLLVHPLHGLFIWAPVTYLSVLGLIFMPQRNQKIGYVFIGTWLLFLFFIGYFNFWYAGWSFSNRYLVNLFPLYAVGLSAFLERFTRKMHWLVVMATIYSIVLFLNWYLCIMDGEYGTPQDMIQAWIKGESRTSVDKKVTPQIFMNRILEMCRYKYFVRGLK